jgi:hypothetical protein
MDWLVERDDDGNGCMTVFDEASRENICVIEGQAVMSKHGLDLRIVFESLTESVNRIYTFRISAVDLAAAGAEMDAGLVRFEAGPGAKC